LWLLNVHRTTSFKKKWWLINVCCTAGTTSATDTLKVVAVQCPLHDQNPSIMYFKAFAPPYAMQDQQYVLLLA